jgi:hypothetical protein
VSNASDYRETIVTYNYEARTAEFYLTRETNCNIFLQRGPHCLKSEELSSGYLTVYSFKQIRTPECLLRVGNNFPYTPV